MCCLTLKSPTSNFKMLTRKNHLFHLVFYDKLEGRLKSSLKRFYNVGDTMTFVSGKYVVRWKVDTISTHDCASEMLAFHGFRIFVLEAKSFEEALEEYYKLYGWPEK